VAWWRLRAEYIHQQLLDEVVAVPDDYFVDIENLEKEMEHGEQDKDLIGRLLLEKGLLRHLLRLDKLAREDFIKAARVMELKYELTGAMGKRTKFQQGGCSTTNPSRRKSLPCGQPLDRVHFRRDGSQPTRNPRAQ
jgi:hypothetical protein